MQIDSSCSTDLLKIASETKDNLRKHILNSWFPRAFDLARGGFSQYYSEDWSPGSSNDKGIVHQSRHTWLTAKAALRFPAEYERFAAFSTHGLKFISDVMWDKDRGGFYWSVDGDGNPLPWKHTYGVAFAIYAAAANYEATGDLRAINLAKQSFEWLEGHARDSVNGGYFDALHLDGRVIQSTEYAPAETEAKRPAGRDVIGTPYGHKSMNTHIHMLEAFSELHSIWPHPEVSKRLREVFEIICTRVVHPDGYLHLYFTPDWHPLPDEDSYGHDIETAYLLIEAAAALDMPDDPATWQIARNLVDHTLTVGWDSEYGGIFRAGTADSGPVHAGDWKKGWWEQAEGLNALLLMHERYGDATQAYRHAFERQWRFIDRYQVDHANNGWFHTLTREGVPVENCAKSDSWTDGYHQGRALMNVTDRLLRLAER